MPHPLERMSTYCLGGRAQQINEISVYHIRRNISSPPLIASLLKPYYSTSCGTSGVRELDLLKRE